MSYQDFIARKLTKVPPTGLSDFTLPDGLFDHQRVLTEWAVKRGRAAIFADTGLGKSRMQLAWASAVRDAARNLHAATAQQGLFAA